MRNWAALIGLVGAMLVYGAYHPGSRHMALTVAALSKLTFVGLVLPHGQRYLGRQVGIAVVVDLMWVLPFAIYFVGVRSAPAA